MMSKPILHLASVNNDFTKILSILRLQQKWYSQEYESNHVYSYSTILGSGRREKSWIQKLKSSFHDEGPSFMAAISYGMKCQVTKSSSPKSELVVMRI